MRKIVRLKEVLDLKEISFSEIHFIDSRPVGCVCVCVCVRAHTRAGVVEVSDSGEKSQKLGLLFGLGCSALQLSPSQQIVIEQLSLQKSLLCPLVKTHR